MTEPDPDEAAQRAIVLPPGGGRRYCMGGLVALFKADEAETGAAYSISEWILEPGQEGVGAHSHVGNDEVFFGLEGTPEVLVGSDWLHCKPGAFIRIPRGVAHDFRNPSRARARLLNLFFPGGFERDMPKIVDWFARN